MNDDNLSILTELKTAIESVGLSVETGVFSDVPPDEYAVITPLSDEFELFADNRPGCDIQGARISIFSKHNYLELKNKLVKQLLERDFTITDRRYIAHESDTGYHHYAIDTQKYYIIEEA